MSAYYERDIQAIVIHHPGDGKPPEVPIEGRWNPEGLDYPAYDFAVEADGTIKVGRPLNVIGAHTKCDKEPYLSRYGQWWFNRNAIGIVVSGDFTKYPMGAVQFNALVGLVRRLFGEYGLTLDNVYPHGQVTYTDCPGCAYSKVPELTKGKWSYDEFEKAVLGEDVDDLLDNLVVYADGDVGAALLLSYKLQCPMILKGFETQVQARSKHYIGTPGTNGNGYYFYAGADRIATAKLGL